MTHELLIKNARIVDGSGAPWFRGAVGITDGRIAEIWRHENPDSRGEETLDAEGDIVCPGFVDLHSHSDLRLLEEPTVPAKTRQGVTTEVLGQDGFSMAPMYRENGAAEWQSQLSGLDGRIDESRWTWGSTSAYLDAIEERAVAQNVAMLVGHGTVRYNVLGMSDRAPDDAELTRMADLVTEALEDGAVGLSTGLIYPPQVHAETEELRALAVRLEPYGRPFFAHIRNQGRWLWEALSEFLSVGESTDVPLHYSHMGMYGRRFNQGRASRALTLLETARDRGIDITADHHFYTQSSTMLRAVLPPWMQTFDTGRMLSKLQDSETRERIRRDIEEWRIQDWENHAMRDGWENITVTSVASDEDDAVEGSTVADIAERRGDGPVEVVCDLLVESELEVSMRNETIAEADIETVLGSERVAVASDGLLGSNPHPRTYGTYPRILGEFVRERNRLSLEAAVRRMTSLPARVVGLDRKGLVRPGMDADLVRFEPDLVRSRATYDQPERHPKGVRDVVVGGEFVVRDEAVTGATPGEAVRQ